MSQHPTVVTHQTSSGSLVAPSPLRVSMSPVIDSPPSFSNTPLLQERLQQIPESPTPTSVPNQAISNDNLPQRPAAITRLSTEQLPSGVSPSRRGTVGSEMTFWSQAPPQSHSQNASFEFHRPPYRPSIPDFNSYGDGPHPIPTIENGGFGDPDAMSTALPQKNRWPSQTQLPRHQKSNSVRSLRPDAQKRQSYRFDALSDIESDSGFFRGANGRQNGPTRMTRYRRETTPPDEILRLPLTWWMNSSAKNHFVATIGEFIGTTMFLFFAFAGTQVANVGAGSTTSTTNSDNGFSPIVLLYIAISFGFSLMVNVWIFFRISGGLFNPAVTLAMTMVKSITYVRAILLLIAQISGSLLASVLVRALFPTPLNVRTTLSADTSLVRGVFIEALLTSELVFAIFMLAKEKHKATFMAPIGIGLALFVAELTGVYYTGGSLNPARSFGPCAVTGVWDHEHWIYWLGPAIGAVLAVCFYRFIKILEYEVANPGQDAKHEGEPDITLPVHRQKGEEGSEAGV